MSRFSLYTLILVGTAVAVFTIGEYHPQISAAVTEDDPGIVAEMPSLPPARIRALPPCPSDEAADIAFVVPCPAVRDVSID